MPDQGSQSGIPDEEKKKPSQVRDITDEQDSLPEELDSKKEEIQDKVEAAEDDEIGVQEVQNEVKKATSTHISDDATEGELKDINADVDSFASKIDGVLQDAGLTKKHVYFCCGGLLVVAVLGIIIFFGIKFFVGFIDNDNPDTPDIPDTPSYDDQVEPGEALEGRVWVDPSVYSGILLGNDSALEVGYGGTEEAEEVGSDAGDFSNVFVYRLEYYQEVVNAYNMDVNDYLNNFEDRSAAVDDLSADYQSLFDEGLEIIHDLEDETAEISVLYDSNSETKDYYENDFFAQFKEYDGDAAVVAMDDFVEISQEQIELKAQYQAKSNLYDGLYNALLYLKAKIEDITLNKEALVKGVQVVDVQGSDLDLFVEGNLE
ncbi:MAG: hypothetical protein ACD_51C00265G0003 [uncultured bacterium]|nr:MAG: hypothetical protein ACD_51C00265G0003 [uncultured bacterium]